MPSRLRHFAMFPPSLVERCVLAGPCQVCSACGAPHAPVVERAATPPAVAQKDGDYFGHGEGNNGIHRKVGQAYQDWLNAHPKVVLGHRPTCPCAAPPVPPLVLDPFLGAGTVAGVCEVLGRRWLGCELYEEYAALIPRRVGEVRAWYARRPLPSAHAADLRR